MKEQIPATAARESLPLFSIRTFAERPRYIGMGPMQSMPFVTPSGIETWPTTYQNPLSTSYLGFLSEQAVTSTLLLLVETLSISPSATFCQDPK